MRAQAIFAFKPSGGCDLIVTPCDKIEDAIKAAAQLATTKDIGNYSRLEVWDSEKGRIRSIFGAAKPQPQTKQESKMKKTLSIIAFFALLIGLTCNAQAQSQTLALGTNGVAVHPATANDIEVATVADVKGANGVCIQVSCNNDSTTAAALGVYFVRSVDGVTFENKAVMGALLPTTATAGASTVYVTNIFQSYPLARYWKLSYLTNNAGATAVITNISVKYSTLQAR